VTPRRRASNLAVSAAAVTKESQAHLGGKDPGFSQPRSLGHELPLHLIVFGAWMVAFGSAALLEYAPNASLWFPPAE